MEPHLETYSIFTVKLMGLPMHEHDVPFVTVPTL